MDIDKCFGCGKREYVYLCSGLCPKCLKDPLINKNGVILPTHEEYLKQKESRMEIEEITQYKVSGTIFDTKKEAVEFMAVEKLKSEINEILVLRYGGDNTLTNSTSLDQIMEAVHTCLEGLTGELD